MIFFQTRNTAFTEEQEELRREKWLEFHDRFTSGTPGLFPLVLDLPVRFADTTSAGAKAMGVFRNARGGTRMGIEEEEKHRMP